MALVFNPTAHERAQAEGKEFLRLRPEFKRDPETPERLGGKRVLLSFDERYENRLSWGSTNVPGNASLVLRDGVDTVLLVLNPQHQDLLRRVYWERQPQEAIAKELGASQQAVSQRIDTAEKMFRKAWRIVAGYNG